MGHSAAYRGWLVGVPKRHAAGLGAVTDDEAAAIGRLLNGLARVLKDTIGADHVYAFVFGDGVPHLHVHLAPAIRTRLVSFADRGSTSGQMRREATRSRCALLLRSSGR